MDATCELLPSVAVTTAVCVLPIVPALAVKVPLLAPLAIVTDAGTVRFALLSLTLTAVLAGADWFKVNVQMLFAPELRLDGLHSTDDSAKGGSNVMEAVCELLPKVAVTMAVCVLPTVPAVTVNVDVVVPPATVTDCGTVRLVLLSLKVTSVVLGAD
ncbi:MAG TPA: hypothetical protein VMI94_20345 [Bryobacteraceae bacterium]|nr:hypothetical protein [Bryobacteraceae bacterium]